MLQLILLILVGFFIGLAYPTGIEPLFFNPFISLFGTIVLTIIYLTVGFIFVRHFFKKLRASSGDDYLKYIKRYYHWVTRYRILVLFVYAIQIFLLHWPLVITSWLSLDEIVFLTNFLILSPFLVSYILSWLPFYQMDRYFRQSTWSLWEYFIFQIRGYFLLVVMPLLVFLLYIDIIYDTPALLEVVFVYPFMGWVMALSIILVMYLVAPFALMVLWGTKPFPEGELRKRLEGLAQRAGLKIRNLLVWSLGRGRMANAMIVGFIPQTRYVIFTDTLLNNLSPEETETVFGHEIGHARHHHLMLYLLFSLGYLSLALTIEEFCRARPGLMTMNLFALVIIYWGVIFGAISREFEKQSDLFGASITNNFEGFIRALQKIAWLNGQLPSARSLQHPSVEKRESFLRAVQQAPEQARKFQHTLNKRLGLFVSLIVLSLILAGWSIFQQFKRAPVLKEEIAIQTKAYQRAQEGYQLIADKRYDKAIEVLNQAIALTSERPFYYIWLGDAFLERDGYLSPEARQAYESAWELKPVDLRERIYLYEQLYQKPSFNHSNRRKNSKE